MHLLYQVSVVLHVLAAMLWVGGMGFFALVVVPVLRRKLGPAAGGEALRAIGIRLAEASWIILGVLIATGVTNLATRGLLPLMAEPAFWSTGLGRTLAVKLAFVALVVASSSAHARTARRAPAAPAPSRARGNLLGRATLAFSVVVVALAVLLARGGA
jgi:copper resistance protein D